MPVNRGDRIFYFRSLFMRYRFKIHPIHRALHYSLLCKKLWEDFRRWTVLLVLWIFDSLFDRRWNRIGCIVQYHLDRISFSYISLFLEIEDAFNSGKFVFDFSIWSLQDREENRNNFCQSFIYFFFFFLDKI